MCVYIYYNINSEMAKPDDKTMEDIREQLALYTKLYYNTRKEDGDWLKLERVCRNRYLEKKRMEKYIDDNDINTSVSDLTPELKAEAQKKKGTTYTLKNCKVISTVAEEEHKKRNNNFEEMLFVLFMYLFSYMSERQEMMWQSWFWE